MTKSLYFKSDVFNGGIKAATSHQITDTNTENQLENFVDHCGGSVAMKWLDHCLNCLHCLSGAEGNNGIADLSPNRLDLNETDKGNILLRLPKAINQTEGNARFSYPRADFYFVAPSERTEDIVMGAVLMGALAEQDARIARIEARFDELADMLTARTEPEPEPTPDFDRLVQLTEKTPDKITIQFFKNEKKKNMMPIAKLEFHNRVYDKNGKGYYNKYQSVHCKCYQDMGRARAEALMRCKINEVHKNALDDMWDLTSRLHKTFLDDPDAIGGVFYSAKTSEVLLGAVFVIHIDDNSATIYICGDGAIKRFDFNFEASKAANTKSGADSIYQMNSDTVDTLLNSDEWLISL
ncbi:MAG: hypothetical protein WCJ64_07675 [Rhodospirillaceae bacterium]